MLGNLFRRAAGADRRDMRVGLLVLGEFTQPLVLLARPDALVPPLILACRAADPFVDVRSLGLRELLDSFHVPAAAAQVKLDQGYRRLFQDGTAHLPGQGVSVQVENPHERVQLGGLFDAGRVNGEPDILF